MTNPISKYFEYAQLAQASYAWFFSKVSREDELTEEKNNRGQTTILSDGHIRYLKTVVCPRFICHVNNRGQTEPTRVSRLSEGFHFPL